ncbi:MAG: hypothetical protein AB7V45_02555 [Candidatus Krumholzibacteriia bacterium]
MSKTKAVLAALLLVLAVSGAFSPTPTNAINPYGGPCDVAEDLGYASPNWNALCLMYVQVIDACCMSGGCSLYPCD